MMINRSTPFYRAYQNKRRRLAQPRAPLYKGLYPTYQGFNTAYSRRINGPTEFKYKLTSVAAENATDAGATVLLNGMQNGTSYTTRIGNQISLYSLELRISWHIISANSALGRMIIYYDKQTNGTTPTTTSLLNNATPMDFKNLGYRNRFRILKDKTMALDSSARDVYFTKYYMKFKRPLVTTYNTTNGGLVADIMTGGLFLLYLSDEGVGDYPTFTAQIKLKFND